jgi:hypothetical protein
MKTWLTLAILPLFLSNCMVVDSGWEQGTYEGDPTSSGIVYGNGVAATEIRSLPAFDKVRVDGSVHVIVKAGSSYSAYVTADANLTDWFRTSVTGNTLGISVAYGMRTSVEPEITIIVPELHGLTQNAGGLIEIEEDGDFPDVRLTSNGSGEIRYGGTAATLTATLNSWGDIVLEGYAALLVADLRGAGSLHGENLLTGDADVASSGSGAMFLDMDYESTLKLSLSGQGRIEWWGSPAKLDYTLLGSGKVIEHRGLPKKAASVKDAAAKVAAPGSAGAQGGLAKRGASAGKPYAIVNGK